MSTRRWGATESASCQDSGASGCFFHVFGDPQRHLENLYGHLPEQWVVPERIAATDDSISVRQKGLGHHLPQLGHNAAGKPSGESAEREVLQRDTRDATLEGSIVPLAEKVRVHAGANFRLGSELVQLCVQFFPRYRIQPQVIHPSLYSLG